MLKLFSMLFVGLVASLTSYSLYAQNSYVTSVTVVIAFAAGAPTDLVTLEVGAKLSEQTGQTFRER